MNLIGVFEEKYLPFVPTQTSTQKFEISLLGREKKNDEFVRKAVR